MGGGRVVGCGAGGAVVCCGRQRGVDLVVRRLHNVRGVYSEGF